MSWAPDKSDIGESGKCLPLFAFRAPRPARVGAVPRGSHYARRRSDVGASRRRYELLSTWEPLWGPDIATLLARPAAHLELGKIHNIWHW